MIVLSKLNGDQMVVNAEIIRSVEQNPDTIVTLINGDHILVRESLREVVEKSIEYGRLLRRQMPRD